MKKLLLFVYFGAAIAAVGEDRFDYRVLATSKTSTMEKEMNEAAAAGFVFSSVMGGETSAGGKEVVTVMVQGDADRGKAQYKLLATSRTGTMQKEMQAAADQGYRYRGQTVFESMFGGKEVAVILERFAGEEGKRAEYRLLATSRTSTMEKELKEAGGAGFRLMGMVVGQTAMGGRELVCILEKAAQ
ncbi:MAG: hypothetical protein JNK87_09825 [Bryobacterales bacterium]|nr:hypothetical protein [Bryobacterales bacterium]